MKKQLDIEFEKAVKFLAEYLPASAEKTRKPILAHDIRVGAGLYERSYSRDIVLAGLLHDALEFSEISYEMLEKEFGENVAKLVSACSKDRSIEDPEKRIEEQIKRCAESGKDALIIKAADILDSFKYYTRENNESELAYCRKNAEEIFRYVTDDFSDEIFVELGEFNEEKAAKP